MMSNRRLYPDEEARILAQLHDTGDERMPFVLALETAMRMRECYTLGVDQVSLPNRTISLERTKNGDTRQVPLSTTIVALLSSNLTANRKAIAARDDTGLERGT
jgi:integrase